MAVKAQTFHIAVCDVCGIKFDEASEYWAWDDTPELALAQISNDPGTHWVVTPDKQVVCPLSDTAHYLARDGESPALLEAGPDAMTVCFGGQIEIAHRAA
ncbi:hypothetical protein ACJ6WF_17240 [Streptomyces sp. MMS24-I2-30]|uniref:hypothetical protein n=1 Tax=Streptomyces sp. MMS24-I2-30 TaxID=3351564 RepID=UPI003896DAF7